MKSGDLGLMGPTAGGGPAGAANERGLPPASLLRGPESLRAARRDAALPRAKRVDGEDSLQLSDDALEALRREQAQERARGERET